MPFRLVRRTKDASPPRAGIEAAVVLHGQDLGTKGRGAVARHTLQAEVRRIRDAEKIRSSDAPISGQSSPWEAMYDNASPAFLVLAYGANRRVESVRTFDASQREKTGCCDTSESRGSSRKT